MKNTKLLRTAVFTTTFSLTAQFSLSSFFLNYSCEASTFRVSPLICQFPNIASYADFLVFRKSSSCFLLSHSFYSSKYVGTSRLLSPLTFSLSSLRPSLNLFRRCNFCTSFSPVSFNFQQDSSFSSALCEKNKNIEDELKVNRHFGMKEKPPSIPSHIWTKTISKLHQNKNHPLGIVKQKIQNFFEDPPKNFFFLFDKNKIDFFLSSSDLNNNKNAISPHSLLCSSPSHSNSEANGGKNQIEKCHYISLKDIMRRLKFNSYDDISPIVKSQDNFDSLLIPKDHPSRSPSDTFYLDVCTRNYLLRTHGTAHLTELMKKGDKAAIYACDVYRKDTIDSYHYPVFHQCDAYALFDELEINQLKNLFFFSALEKNNSIYSVSLSKEEKHVLIEPQALSSQNPHSKNIVVLHLQLILEALIHYIFSTTFCPSIRWNYDVYFPFTNPSMELEIFFNGKWVEVLGAGGLHSQILKNVFFATNTTEDNFNYNSNFLGNNSDNLNICKSETVEGQSSLSCNVVGGWAAGIGLERLSMILFDIRDIRTFWSTDSRFYKQFSEGKISKYVPFSKLPPVYKDVAFWCDNNFDEMKLMDICRELADEYIEEIKLIDTYTNKETNKTSRCYRICYRAIDRTLTHQEVNKMQNIILQNLVQKMALAIR